MLTVTIPLPPKELSPNYRSRTHHAKTRATKEYREAARAAGLHARLAVGMPKPAFERVLVSAVFYCGPTKIKVATGKDDRCRPADDDNALACLKPAMDGLRDAGLFPDDRSGILRQSPPRLLRLKKEHGGRAEVVLTLTALTDETGGGDSSRTVGE